MSKSTKGASAPLHAPAKVIQSRDDLSFTCRDDKERLVSWSVPHDQNGFWHVGIEVGLQHFSEAAELAQFNEYEAFVAMNSAMNTPGWQPYGWGIEEGFSRGMVAAAIVGLRALRAGAEPYNYELEQKRWLEAEDGCL